MAGESLIRRLKRAAPDAAFVVLFAAALVTGGGAALAGLPKFLDAALPGMEAQALPPDGFAHGVARFVLPPGTDSPYSPQVLYPVTTGLFPDWLADAIQARKSGVKSLAGPVIAICIDDLGEDIAGTDKAMALPREVALSFLPFADASAFLAERAGREGHLILAHVPMQAVGPQNPGPMALTTGLPPEEIARRLGWHLSRVPGLVGINNHEGSKFTADATALMPVMATLKARHLFFFDSRTGPDSKVAAAADAAGVMTAARDIFLDDDQSAASVGAQLDALAATARRTGVAIAIGHPHDVTLKLLAAWLKQGHGVTLVPLDEAIRLKAGRETAMAAR